MVSTVSGDAGTVVNSVATILTILDDISLNLPVQIDKTDIADVQVLAQVDELREVQRWLGHGG